MRYLTLVLLTLLCTTPFENALGQKKPLLQEKEAVVAAATAELDSLMRPGNSLNKEGQELNIKGEFIIDITVFDKGKIQSVYMVSSDADDIKMQNRAKDLVRRVVFNFKLPKGKNYKFQYTFKFT